MRTGSATRAFGRAVRARLTVVRIGAVAPSRPGVGRKTRRPYVITSGAKNAVRTTERAASPVMPPTSTPPTSTPPAITRGSGGGGGGTGSVPVGVVVVIVVSTDAAVGPATTTAAARPPARAQNENTAPS